MDETLDVEVIDPSTLAIDAPLASGKHGHVYSGRWWRSPSAVLDGNATNSSTTLPVHVAIKLYSTKRAASFGAAAPRAS